MTTVPKRRIGTSGPEVSVLALGSWHTYDRMDFHDGAALLRRAVNAGIDLFDVGVYGGVPLDESGKIHHSFTDVIFGRLVEHAGIAREDYRLSEKLWLEPWPQITMSAQLQRALERVGTDRADLAVLGDIRTETINYRALVLDLAEAVRSGLLGAWGVNNWSVADLRATHEAAQAEGVPGPQLAQLKYSPCRRAMADDPEYRALLAETGISLQASDVFEGGMLAGRVGSDRMVGRDPGGVRERIAAVAPRLREIAAGWDATPAQVAVAFGLTHPATATVLFGASRMEQLEDNLGALDLLERVGAEPLRAAVDELWVDQHVGA